MILTEGKYILVNGEPVKEPNLIKWANWLETHDRTVAKTKIRNKDKTQTIVSTVFLGIDHNFSGEGEPLLYETMVFGGEHDQEMVRTSTKQEAKQAHLDTVWEVKYGK